MNIMNLLNIYFLRRLLR